MRTLLLTTVFALATTLPVSAASLPMANGYGAIDAPRDIDAVSLGEAFCEARVTGDMSALAKYFAPKLVAVLNDIPDADIPWQTYADHPTACAVEVLNGADNTVGVLLKVSYTAPGRAWSDTLNLERTPDSWLINNVFYESGGNLRFRLFSGT